MCLRKQQKSERLTPAARSETQTELLALAWLSPVSPGTWEASQQTEALAHSALQNLTLLKKKKKQSTEINITVVLVPAG